MLSLRRLWRQPNLYHRLPAGVRPMRTFRIAMVQMNPTVGDLDGNLRRITAWLREAKKAKADLVAFPELAITGYPP